MDYDVGYERDDLSKGSGNKRTTAQIKVLKRWDKVRKSTPAKEKKTRKIVGNHQYGAREKA